MLAANYNLIENIKLLINAGADINAKNNDGKTALIIAANLGHSETAKLLIDNGAKWDKISILKNPRLFKLVHPNKHRAAIIGSITGIGIKIWQYFQK